MLKFAVFGFGYWGPNIVRNLLQIGVEVKYIVDKSAERRKEASSLYPDIIIDENVDCALNDPEVVAVAIVLPVFLHHKIAKMALNAGKHVLVEKPMASNSKECEELIKIAEDKRLVLMVDHTYLYSDSILKIKKHFVSTGDKIRYFDSERMNLGKYQYDINVVWDLAPHDLAVLEYLMESNPVSISANGIPHPDCGLEDLAYLIVRYGSGAVAHLSVSWVTPIKIRKMMVGGYESTAIFDDLDNERKLRIFSTNFNYSSDIVDCRVDKEIVPIIDKTETLSVMLLDFVKCVQTGEIPVSNSKIGLNVVKLLEAAQKSIKSNGAVVKIR